MSKKANSKNKIRKKEENIWNVPNTLTLLRVIITFIIIYLILAKFSTLTIVIFFIIGMLTDFLDGQIARKFSQVTEFGRKFDMIADRFLVFATIGMFVLSYSFAGDLSRTQILQIFLCVSREIISLPFALAAFWVRARIPDARFIGKLTTVLQGFTFPMILLSADYSIFNFSIYFAIATFIVGLISAMYYVYDLKQNMNSK